MVTSVYVDHSSSSHIVKEFDGKHDPATIANLERQGFEFMGYGLRQLHEAEGNMLKANPHGVSDAPWVSLP